MYERETALKTANPTKYPFYNLNLLETARQQIDPKAKIHHIPRRLYPYGYLNTGEV